jgi:O-antigen/teichoic acid export membrane protein
MSILVVVLNYFFIDWFGIDGAALSTVVVIVLFNTLKILYVKSKFQIIPFSKQTWLAIFCIVIVFIPFYFISFPFHPIVNIILESGLIGLVYILLILKLRISEDINRVVSKVLQRFLK